MTSRVGPKGQVVIPKPMRDALGLEPGSKVHFELDGSTVHVRSAGIAAFHELRGRYRGSDLLDDLARERALDLEREERRIGRS